MTFEWKTRHQSTKHGKITRSSRGGSRNPTTSKTQLPVTTVNNWKPLTIVTKNTIPDTAPVLYFVQKYLSEIPLVVQLWQIIPVKSSSDYLLNSLTLQNTKIYHENSSQNEIWRTLFVKCRTKYYNARNNNKNSRTRWVTVVSS